MLRYSVAKKKTNRLELRDHAIVYGEGLLEKSGGACETTVTTEGNRVGSLLQNDPQKNEKRRRVFVEEAGTIASSVDDVGETDEEQQRSLQSEKRRNC
jgi:hypothetical protein